MVTRLLAVVGSPARATTFGNLSSPAKSSYTSARLPLSTCGSGGGASRGGARRKTARSGAACDGRRMTAVASCAAGGGGEDAGSGSGRGGGGDRGGGGGDKGRNEDEDCTSNNDGWYKVAGLAWPALALQAHHAHSPPHAQAGAGSKPSPVTTTSPGDMAICFTYGFAWSYGIKFALKRLFVPVALFVASMFLLTTTGALPKNLLQDAYKSYIKPCAPKEWLSADLDVVGDVVKSGERRFWASVHRVLPVSNNPLAEKAFFAGILLSGLV